MITRAQQGQYSKIQTTIPMVPFVYTSFTGIIILEYKCNSLEVAKKKLKKLKNIKRIGRCKADELGRIHWLEGRIEESTAIKKRKRYGKIKIRKGLPPTLPFAIRELLIYGLLHDFVHTAIHRSKIYVELALQDQELLSLLRESHSQTTHFLVKTFKKYDQQAAYLTRKNRSKRTTRYNYHNQNKENEIDFQQLADQITKVVNTRNVFRVYEFIYNSVELARINESLEYAQTNLRFHLLLIANMIVRDYQHGYLDEFLVQYKPHFSQSNEKNTVAPQM